MWNTLFVGLFLVTIAVYVDAASSPGPFVASCNASTSAWGCVEWNKRRSGEVLRLQCKDTPEPHMSWASKVVFSDKYITWAGKEDNKLSEYVPGAVMDINIRVVDYEEKYRGILIYALSEQGQRVGEWLIPEETTPFFQLPWPDSHSCGQSLMHNDASLKPLKSTWKWKAPPAGTGKVTFECLIKQGPANHGAFYWPNKNGHLQLSESSSTKPTQTWFTSELDQSCTERCAQESLLCDKVLMESIDSGDAIDQTFLPQSIPCTLPYVGGCTALGTSMGVDGLCYYDEPLCEDEGRNTDRVTCESKDGNAANGMRICKCARTTLPPSTVSQRGAQQSPASKSTFSSLLVVLALIGLTTHSSGKTTTSIVLSLFLIALVTLPTGTHAHNWVYSGARAKNRATTQRPCPPRVSPAPHVQVGPNQKFEIEWSSGHRGVSYWVILKGEDEHRLREISRTKLREYFEEAPPEARKSLPSYHRHFVSGTKEFDPNQFKREIPETSPDFLPRPDHFGSWPANAQLFEYKDSITKDNYAEYVNPKMPYVEAMYKSTHHANRAGDGDMVQLTIPGRGGLGSYVIQWWWSGYRDCVDVDYQPNQVDKIYGERDTGSGFVRIDHCYFPNRRSTGNCQRVFNNLGPCKCGNCFGFAVMPRILPDNPYNDKANLIPSNCDSQVKLSDLTNAGEDPKDVNICFSVTPRGGSDTLAGYEVVNEGDPAYHSTCYIKSNGRKFANIVLPKLHQDIPWRHGEKCISCHAANYNKNTSRIPRWPLTDKCRNCDLEPVTTPTWDPPRLILVKTDTACDGMGNYWRGRTKRHTCKNGEEKDCFKQLFIRGRVPDFNQKNFHPTECAAVAAMDPDCSDTVITTKQRSLVTCRCQTKIACCNQCKQIDAGFRNKLYTLHRGTPELK